MRIALLGLASAALFAAGTAQAVVTFSTLPGAPDPGPAAGQTIVVDFDNPNAPGYVFSAGINTAIGSLPGVYAAPAGDTTVFGYVSSAVTPNTTTLTTPKLDSISLYVGSIDTFNLLEVLDGSGNVLLSIPGSLLPPADGDQGASDTNRRVFIDRVSGAAIEGLRFTSTGVAFEFDDIATTAVPEPATWAMLIAGFGLVGFAARRRRATVAA
jgi:hypothetical protein